MLSHRKRATAPKGKTNLKLFWPQTFWINANKPKVKSSIFRTALTSPSRCHKHRDGDADWEEPLRCNEVRTADVNSEKEHTHRETLFSWARGGAISKLGKQSPHMKNTMESIRSSQVNRWVLWSIPHPWWLLGDPARSQLPSASIVLWCSTGRYLKFLRTRNMKCGPARNFF